MFNYLRQDTTLLIDHRPHILKMFYTCFLQELRHIILPILINQLNYYIKISTLMEVIMCFAQFF